jgi:hypothetical protein
MSGRAGANGRNARANLRPPGRIPAASPRAAVSGNRSAKKVVLSALGLKRRRF